jgi:hypothetical protein
MCVCSGCRFIDEIIENLSVETNGINTLNQFGGVKIDEIEWPPLTPAGKNSFVRLAMRKYKAAHGAPTIGSEFVGFPRFTLSGDAEKGCRGVAEKAPEVGVETQCVC